ncbi:unnamed protein product [Scytosiphon promiscuus]
MRFGTEGMSVTVKAGNDRGSLVGSAASKRMVASSGVRTEPGESDPADSRCLDALVVAIDQASDMREWYTETKELLQTSLKLCEACRGAHTVHLRVDDDTPTTLLATVDAPDAQAGRGVLSRVRRPRARRVTWKLSSVELLGNPMGVWDALEELRFGVGFNTDLTVLEWPRRLRKIDFRGSSRFNRPIAGVVWPSSLQDLMFGDGFNQPIEGVTWPPSLLDLSFGADFDQPIGGVTLPSTLRTLVFIGRFNQPINDVKWPGSLQELLLWFVFDQPICEVTWPASLQQLGLGHNFNQPIEGVAWPLSMQALAFGTNFNQPINRVRWPTSLQTLDFGASFNQSIDGVTWPQSLKQVQFGSSFNQPVDTIEWPASLRGLMLGQSFRQSLRRLGTVMPCLEWLDLQFWSYSHYHSLLRDIEWPVKLKHLIVRADADLYGIDTPPDVLVLYENYFEW